MSIQAGLWNLDGNAVDRNALQMISRGTRDYGPDGETIYLAGSIGMIYQPFHTTLQSHSEHQPSVFDDGKVMTWDGRLDNRDELLAQVDLAELTDQTDLAIAQAAFNRWGTNCFGKLVGDWALSIWNPHDRELILARDYAGIRHLFYYPQPNKVTWSTCLDPLALCGDRFTLSDEYIASYLALWPDANLTPYREIYPVPPASFVCIRRGQISISRHWVFDPDRRIRYKKDTEYEDQFLHLFRRAVASRLRTDSPVLADLSGGLDSSSIVCMADDILNTEGKGASPIDTFSFIVNDEPNEEDSSYLRKIQEKREQFGHNAVINGLSDASPFEFSTFSATPGLTGRFEMDTAKADVIKHGGYRVILSGTGGDEMLGQALDPRIQIADMLRGFRVKEFCKQLWIWSLLLRRPWVHLLRDCVLLNLPASIRAQVTEVAKADPWVSGTFAAKQRLAIRQLAAAEGPWHWLPSVRDWFQTITTLTRQMCKAGPIMAEIRYPFLDRPLVEFLTSIPTEQLLRPGQRRSLMRRSLATVVPHEILQRLTKGGGGRYFSALLAKHWAQVESSLKVCLMCRLGYIDRAEFVKALIRLKNGVATQDFLRLVRALSLEMWLQNDVVRRIIELPSMPTAHVQSPCSTGHHSRLYDGNPV